MKNIIVLPIFLFVSAFSFGQLEVNKIEIKTTDIEEFNELDWEWMKDILTTYANKELTLVLTYDNTEKHSKVKIDHFEMSFQLTYDAFETDKERIKTQLKKLILLEKKYREGLN